MANDGMSRWLESLDDERLTSLVERRLARVHRLPSSFDELASLLSQLPSCTEAVRRVDRTAAQVVALIAESGGRGAADELAAALRLPAQEVRAALERAEEQGLAWPVGDDAWRTPGGLRHQVPVLLARGPSYLQLLDGMRLQELRALLQAHGLGGARSSADAVDALGSALPRRVPQLLADEPRAADALRQVAATGQLPEDEALAERMVTQGLLLDVQGAVYLPAEVEEVLRAGRSVLHVAAQPPRQQLPAAPPPVDGALQLLAAAGRVLQVLAEEPVKPLVSGGLGVQVLRRLAKTVEAELDDLVLLLQLMAAAGLVAVGDQAGAVTARGLRWRSLPEEQAYVQLVRPQLHPRAVLEDPQASLSGLLLGVSRSGFDMPPVRRVAAASAARGPEPDGSLAAWLDWSRWRPGGRTERLRALAQPLHVLDLLALRAAGTPAPWLGPLLEAPQPGPAPGRGTAAEEAEADSACAAAAELLAAQLPPAQADVVLQADGTAFVAGRADAGLRQLLDLVARRESEHTWRLHPIGVREALDAGRTGEDLLAELTRRARHGVPSAVERLVRDVADAHGRISVHEARTVLRLADELLGVELLHDKRLKALGLVEIAPGVVASSRPPAEVVAALRSTGHAPVGDGAAVARGTGKAARPRAGGRTAAAGGAWGHDAAEVVRHLRTAPARSPQLTRSPGREQVSPAVLLRRLEHLSGPEAALLLHALRTGAPIEIDYVDSAGAPTTRVVEALEDTGHLLVGHCRLREDERMFAPLGILSVRPATVS
jgi:hypothetical protein